MQWNSEPFVAVFDALQDPGLQVEDAVQLAAPVAEDLAKLLASPAKSDVSRQALGKQLVKFDGIEYRLSADFVNAAAQVSDELNLDELVAAQLVHHTYSESERRGISPVDAALAGYYTRRQYILGISTLVVERFGAAAAPLLGAAPFADAAEALRAVERRLVDLDEKTKRGEFMGLDMNLRFVQTLRVQRDFLVQEHQELGVLAARLAKAGLAPVDAVLSVLTHMGTFTTYSTRLFAYVAVVAAYFGGLDPYLGGEDKASLSDADAGRVFSALTGEGSQFKLKWWHGGVQLLFLVFYAGFLTTSDRSKHSYAEVLSAARVAINSGGLEVLMALASDVNASPSLGSATGNDFSPVVRTRVPVLSAWSPTVYPELATLIFSGLELATEAFTANLADILKEMRLNEEDMYLAQTTAGAPPDPTFAPSQSLLHVSDGRLQLRESSDPQTQPAAPASTAAAGGRPAGPGRDLERFFLFVAYLYRNRPDAGLKFWEEKQNALHGFLVWASQCQVAFMAATFAELLAAVATGPRAAEHCHAFLLQPVKTTNVFVLRWQSVHDLFGHYVAEMRGEDGEDKEKTEFRGVDEDTLMVSLAYLALVRQVVGDCPAAATATSAQPDLVAQVFRLLRYQTPMVASLLAALAAYARHIDALRLGTELAEWAFAATIYVPGSVLRPLPTLPPRLLSLLRSVPEVLAFTALVRVLAPRCAVPRLEEYTQFVLGEVLVAADKIEAPDRVVMLEAALALAHELGPAARRLLATPPVYSTLFGVLATQLEQIADLPGDHLLVRAVVTAMRVVIDLLSAGVVEPMLFNLQTVPNLALFMGSLHAEVARVSVQLFSLLKATPEFMAGGGRSDRVLSILQSASDSDRIRYGLIEQLQREDAPADLRLAVLDLLIAYLATESDTKGTVAHQLLGFRVHALGHLALDTAPGGIASGASLLDTVCSMLGAALEDMAPAVTPGAAAIAARTSQIVAHLCRDPLSSTLVLEHLRKSDFLLTLLDLEPTLSASPGDAAADDFLAHRANLLDMLAHEVHHVAQGKMLQLLNRYQQTLMDLRSPTTNALRLLDFMKFDTGSAPQLQCLQSWCRLVPVLVNTPGNHLTFVLETIQTLVPKLAQAGRTDPQQCRPLASLLVLLLEQYQTSIGRDTASLDRLHPLFQAAVLAVQAAASLADLRADLYVICYQIIKMALVHGDRAALEHKLRVVVTAGARLISTVASDALGFNDRLRLVALIFLYDLAALARRVDSPFVEQALVRYNVVQLLIQAIPVLDTALARQGASPAAQAAGAADRSALKVTLALLLQLAQTRYGADFVLGSGLIDTLDQSMLLKPSASGQLPNNDVLLVLFRLVATAVVAMGAENKDVIAHARQLLERHQHLLMVVLRTDAESHGLGNVAELADVVVLLVSLTGFVPGTIAI